MVRIALAFLIAVLTVASSPSFAERARAKQTQSYSGTSQEQSACSPDARRLCRKVGDDQNAVLSCLQLNKFKLRKPCRELLQSHGML